MTRKLSPTMIHVLRMLRGGREAMHGCTAPAQSRGRMQTIHVLARDGFIDDDYRITAAGMAQLEKEDRK